MMCGTEEGDGATLQNANQRDTTVTTTVAEQHGDTANEVPLDETNLSERRTTHPVAHPGTLSTHHSYTSGSHGMGEVGGDPLSVLQPQYEASPYHSEAPLWASFLSVDASPYFPPSTLHNSQRTPTPDPRYPHERDPFTAPSAAHHQALYMAHHTGWPLYPQPYASATAAPPFPQTPASAPHTLPHSTTPHAFYSHLGRHHHPPSTAFGGPLFAAPTTTAATTQSVHRVPPSATHPAAMHAAIPPHALWAHYYSHHPSHVPVNPHYPQPHYSVPSVPSSATAHPGTPHDPVHRQLYNKLRFIPLEWPTSGGGSLGLRHAQRGSVTPPCPDPFPADCVDLFVAQLPFEMPVECLQTLCLRLGLPQRFHRFAYHCKKSSNVYDGSVFAKVRSIADAHALISVLHKAVLFDDQGVWFARTSDEKSDLAQYCNHLQQLPHHTRQQVLVHTVPFSALSVEFAHRSL